MASLLMANENSNPPPGITIDPNPASGPPPGVTLDPQAASGPPPGVTLDAKPNGTGSTDQSFLAGLAAGFKTGLNQTGETAMRALGAIPGVGTALRSTPGWQQSQAQTHEIANQPIVSGGQMAGYGIENMLEFAAGDEALKGLSMAAKIQEMARVEKALKSSPVLTRMLGNAVRAQAVGTAQASVHGATPTQAILTGTTAALTGAAFHGVQLAGSNLLNLIRPTTTEALGETLPVLASQRAGASPMAESIADIRSEPQTATAQQQRAQRGIVNRAQQTAARELDKLNAARRTRWETGQATMNLAPEPQPPVIPPEQRLTTGAAELPAATATGAPELGAGEQGAQLATRGQIGPYEGPEGPTPTATAAPGPTTTAAAPSTPGGRTVSYIEERPPNFAPIDVENEVSGIRSFGDAADKIREHATPVYDTLDRATGGEFSRLRLERDAAYGRGDYQGVRNAEQAIDGLFNDSTRGKIDRHDYQAVKSAWRSSKILDAVHDAVSRSFNIGDESLAEEAGTWRGINGGRLMNGVNRLVRDYGKEPVNDVIGRDGLAGLLRIADLTQTPQRAALYGQRMDEMANSLASVPGVGKTPALVAWTRRLLLHQVAVNPRVARAVEFATDNKIAPSLYAPLIGSMIGTYREISRPIRSGSLPSEQRPAAAAPAAPAAPPAPAAAPLRARQPANSLSFTYQGTQFFRDADGNFYDSSGSPLQSDYMTRDQQAAMDRAANAQTGGR